MAELNPLWLNGGCVTAQDIRLMPDDLVCTEGVAKKASGSLLVSTGLAGLSVQVAAGGAFILGDQVAGQGMYHVFNDAAVSVPLDAAHPTLPRIDIVVAQVLDSEYSGASDAFVLATVTGTATSGANLTNLNGIGSLADNSIALAYVLVPAAATLPGSLTFTDVRADYQLCAANVPTGLSFIGKQVFLVDGSFTKASFPRGTIARIRAIGGGGAGGGGANVAAQAGAGGGGGSGAYSESWVLFSAMAASETVDIGDGGVGVSGAGGGNGAQTTFGTAPLVRANGGGGATVGSAGTTVGGFLGGTAGDLTSAVGDVKLPGEPGDRGSRYSGTSGTSGKGGRSALAGGGNSRGSNGNGNAGLANTGSGGSGGLTENGAGATTGGNGGSGIVIVEVFG